MATYTNTHSHKGIKTANKANEIQLNKKALYRVEHRKGNFLIKALRGDLWVTLPGDSTDHVLKAGDHLAVASRGRVLIEAMTDASFQIR
jgi:hypothetical protein